MELYNKKDNPNLNLETGGAAADPSAAVPNSPVPPAVPADDLRAEGIDLVGSGVREDNEFTAENVIPPSFTPRQPTPEKEAVVVGTPFSPTTSPDSSKIKNDPSIKPVRTFKTDAEEAVRYQNISAVDIAVAEQKKREKTPIQYVEEKPSRPGALVAAAFVLIIILAGGWFYWFKTSQIEKPEPVRASIETIIPYTTGSTLVLRSESDSLMLIGTKLRTANAGLGNVYALVPTLKATSTTYADISFVFADANMPDRLARSLAPEYMIGTYTYDVNGPFVIFKNTFFQNAFAGMLEWEKDMRNDFLPLIQVSYPSDEPVPADTDKFEDVVISNIDARALRGGNGRIILAYIFADPETMVVATNENTLKYVLDRLLTVKTVQ